MSELFSPEVIWFMVGFFGTFGFAINAVCLYQWVIKEYRPYQLAWWKRWGLLLLVFVPWSYPVGAVLATVIAWVCNV